MAFTGEWLRKLIQAHTDTQTHTYQCTQKPLKEGSPAICCNKKHWGLHSKWNKTAIKWKRLHFHIDDVYE